VRSGAYGSGVLPAPAPVQGPNANSFPSLSSTVRLFLVTGQVVEKAWWDTTIHKFYGFGDSAWSCTPSDASATGSTKLKRRAIDPK